MNFCFTLKLGTARTYTANKEKSTPNIPDKSMKRK